MIEVLIQRVAPDPEASDDFGFRDAVGDPCLSLINLLLCQCFWSPGVYAGLFVSTMPSV